MNTCIVHFLPRQEQATGPPLPASRGNDSTGVIAPSTGTHDWTLLLRAQASYRAGTFAGHSRDYSAVIAAIPIFALVALCLLAIAVSLMGAAFRTAKAIGSPRAITAAKRMPRAPHNPIHLLRWATLPIRSRSECARGDIDSHSCWLRLPFSSWSDVSLGVVCRVQRERQP